MGEWGVSGGGWVGGEGGKGLTGVGVPFVFLVFGWAGLRGEELLVGDFF